MVSAALGPIIGIDLGTTHSSVGVFEDGQVRLLPNVHGEVLTPSAVALDGNTGRFVVGRAAKDIIALHPERGALNFKRWMGSQQQTRLGGRSLSAPELSAYVLESLRRDAERALNQSLSRCVISVPAYFAEPQRLATTQAAHIAGLVAERLINEPTAAALAYGIEADRGERQFMVFDLGGGTFDVCVMELFEGVLRVKGVAGDSQLGGEDFTAALLELTLARAGVTRAELLPNDAVTATRRAELLKRKLSRWPAAEIQLPTPSGERTLTLSAADADAAYGSLLERLKAPCRSALRAAGVSMAEVQDVLLVGGATNLPRIRQFVQETLAKAPTVADRPELVVTRGAALYAGMCARDRALEDRVVTDVASHSLGLQISTRLGNQLVSGRFHPMIERGTVLPTSRLDRFSTLFRNQTAIKLRVFEGDARDVAENTLLGEVELGALPLGEPRAVVEVRFSYDSSGLLEVEARSLETEQVQRKILARDGRTLSTPELEQAKARLAQLRADPAEGALNRELLARAHLLWKDVVGEGREGLEAELGAFEEALQTRTPALIASAGQRLERLCARLEQGERW